MLTQLGYEHLAKKFEQAVLTHVGRDGLEISNKIGKVLTNEKVETVVSLKFCCSLAPFSKRECFLRAR